METVHVSVLLHEVLEQFLCVIPAKAGIQGQETGLSGNTLDSRSKRHEPADSPSGNDTKITYLDGTLGGAGHALAITKALNGDVTIIGLDRDMQAIDRAHANFDALKIKLESLTNSNSEVSINESVPRVILEKEDYRNLDKVLEKNGVGKVDFILLDLGISSDELDASGRGFSFQREEPLLMTMGDPKDYPFTAKDILNNWQEEDIANVIFGYGEETFARRIARAVIAYREKKQIVTTTEFAELVKMSVPAFYRRGKTHPATKSFQALRIAVNDELGALREGLEKGFRHLSPGGRMAVISFHSLEDRIVKEFFKAQDSQIAKILTKKPIRPGPQEVAENPRSRSAKMRVIERMKT